MHSEYQRPPAWRLPYELDRVLKYELITAEKVDKVCKMMESDDNEIALLGETIAKSYQNKYHLFITNKFRI